jgi:DNA-binding NtrC family response regulator
MSDAAVIVRHNSGEASLPTAGSVLIIDDEAAIRESLETLLELEGYGVESAASGEEGLARIGERSFDLVLLDLALPDRNGMDLLAEIHLQDPGLSIIMVTAYGTVENAARRISSRSHGTTRNCLPMCARRLRAIARRKKTFSSSAPSSSATTSKT